MTVQRLLFESTDGSTLFETDGTTVSQLADGSSSPPFAEDPIYGAFSAIDAGSDAYFVMADTTGASSAIWQYNGTALTQITASANYVYNQADSNNPTASQPLVSYNNDLIFSQASLASNVAGDGNFDTATLAVYNPATGTITQPTTPDGGYDPHDFTTIGSTLYFEATDDKTNAYAIYSFNGTSVTEIYDLAPTNSPGNGAAAVGAVEGPMVAFNGNIYFGSGDQSVEELTATGSLSNSATNVAAAVTLTNAFGTGSGLIVSNNHLFFDSGNSGVYSLSTSNVLTQVLANAQYYFPVVYNNALYFTAAPVNSILNLYSSTGGAATEVKATLSTNDLIVMGGTLYYNDDGATLGTYNGSTFGTETVPNGAGGVPLAVVSVATTSWDTATNPITVTAGATVTYHTGGPAVTLDPGLTLTDSASTTLTSAAVVIGSADFVTGDLLNFTSQNGITGSYNANTGELTLTGTATTAAYRTALESVTYSFSPTGGDSGDGDSTNDGTNFSRTISWAVSDGVNNSIAATSSLGTLCFCDGTMIATPAGEVEVEKLVAGDMVLTAAGEARQVVWAGAGRVLATRGRRGPATPVIVRKGALATNVPHVDLRVTKGHSLLLDGVLIPVEFLINHRSILWDDHAQEVSLRHIELETHDVLLANGVAAESYRDDGNRWLFQNANAGWGLPPQEPCAPVLTGGEIVDRVWRRLLDRSGPRALPPLTDDADLHLLVDGQRVDAAKREGRLYSFRLPANAADVRIVSRDAVPAELGLARDFRSLGVALRWIELLHGPDLTRIEAGDDRLADGFHLYEPEGDLRWTNGDAGFPLALPAGSGAAVDVVLYIAATTRYPLLAGEREAA
jgi:hypothetical protein